MNFFSIRYSARSLLSYLRGDYALGFMKSTPSAMLSLRAGRAASRRSCSEAEMGPIGWMVSTPLGCREIDR